MIENRVCFRMVLFLLWFALFASFGNHTVAATAPEPPEVATVATGTATDTESDNTDYRVLLIFSTNGSNEQHLLLSRGFFECLGQKNLTYSLDVLELNLLQEFPPEQLAAKREKILSCIQEEDFDVVIIFGESGKQLLMPILPQIPQQTTLLFSNIQTFEPEIRQIHPNATAVIRPVDPASNITLAKQLFPQLKEIVLLTSSKTWDDKHSQQLDIPSGVLLRTLYVEHDKDLERRLLKKIALLPENSVLISFGWDMFYPNMATRNQLWERIRQVYQGRILVRRENLLQYALGGVTYSVEQTGALTAGQLLDTLLEHHGSAAEVPVQKSMPIVLLNYPELQRWGISEKMCPYGAQLIGKPDFFHDHRGLILSVMILLGAIGAYLSGFLVYFFKYRKEAARNRETLALLRESCRHSDMTLFRLDLDTLDIIPWESNFPRFWPQNANGKPLCFQDWVSSQEWPKISNSLIKLKSGETSEVVTTFRNSDTQDPRYFLLRCNVLGIPASRTTSCPPPVIGLIQEVTELARNEERMQNTSLLLQCVLDNIPFPIYTKDVENDLRYTMCNQAMANYYHASPEEFVQKNDRELLPKYPEYANSLWQSDRKIVAESRPGMLKQIQEYGFDDQHRKIFQAFKGVIQMSNGKRLLLGMSIDVTRERTLEQENLQIICRLNNHIDNAKIINDCLRRITEENDFTPAVHFMLETIGTKTDADRIYLFEYENLPVCDIASCTFEWVREGVAPQQQFLQHVSSDIFGSFHSRIMNGKNVVLEDINNPPEDLLDTILPLREQSILSLLGVPLSENDQIIGFLGVDHVHQKCNFSDSDIAMLQDAGNLILLARTKQQQRDLLTASMALQKQIVDNIQLPISIIDNEFHLLIRNPACAPYYEKSPGEKESDFCYLQLCGFSEPPDWCPARKILQGETYASAEMDRNGRHLRLVAQAVLDNDGKLTRIIESAADITEEREHQRELERKEQETHRINMVLQSFLEHDRIIKECMEYLLLGKDISGTMHFIVKRIGEALQGTTCSINRFDALQYRYFESVQMWTKSALNVAQSPLRRIYRKDFPCAFDILLREQTLMIDLNHNEAQSTPEVDEIRPYLDAFKHTALFCTPIKFRGKVWGMLGIEKNGSFPHEIALRLMNAASRVIEVLLEAEENRQKLLGSEAEKRMILNILPSPVILYDTQMHILSANPAALSLVHQTEAQVMQTPCCQLFCRNANTPENCAVQETIRTMRPQQQERTLLGKPFLISTRPCFDEKGCLTGVLKSMFDLTEMNRSKELLKQAADQAEEAAHAKSVFLATMSHEIRTPLNAVIGFSELLQDAKLEEEERSDYLKSIHLAGNALLNLINDILDLSRIESAQMQIIPEQCDFASLCAEIGAIFRHRLEAKSIQMLIECPTNLPLLYLDTKRMRQILFNLVGNAVKFTMHGFVRIHVSFGRSKGENRGRLRFEISDSGIGISRKMQQKIFEPFVQDESVRGLRAESGSGLGLTISKRLVEAMHGSITLKSELQCGSTFTVELPVSIIAEAALPTNAPEAETQPAMTRPDKNLKLLLVDDVPLNLRVLQAMAEKMHCECRCATSGAEALKLLKESTVDWVLSDMWMPGMSGLDLARTIRSQPEWAAIKIAAVTADAEASHNFDMKYIDAMLLKPISKDSLQSLLFEGGSSLKKSQ